jgi:protein gp37
MTKIEWTDLTLNPGLYGCTAVSPACEFCYAASMALRLATMPHTRERYEGAATRVHGRAAWTGKVKVDPDAIGVAFGKLPKGLRKCPRCSGSSFCRQEGTPAPIWKCPDCTHGKRPWRCFVTSMSDLFHPDVPFSFIDRVFEEMTKRPHIHFQVLTKRPERMAEYAVWLCGDLGGFTDWPENVWAGCTVEDQTRANLRVPHLLRVPAPVRFLSMEPLRSRVNLSRWLGCGVVGCDTKGCNGEDGPCGVGVSPIHWVIAGGESGHNARASHQGWFRDLRDQARQVGVSFFFKQWGEWAPGNGGPGGDLYDRIRRTHDGAMWGEGGVGSGPGARSGFFTYSDAWHELGPNPFRQTMDRVGKAEAGRTLDGMVHSQFPNV